MLPCVCSEIDHRGRENMVRTSVTHSAAYIYIYIYNIEKIVRALWLVKNPCFIKYKTEKVCFIVFRHAKSNRKLLVTAKNIYFEEIRKGVLCKAAESFKA